MTFQEVLYFTHVFGDATFFKKNTVVSSDPKNTPNSEATLRNIQETKMVKESIAGLISRLKKAPKMVRKIQRGKALQGGEILIGHPIPS